MGGKEGHKASEQELKDRRGCSLRASPALSSLKGFGMWYEGLQVDFTVFTKAGGFVLTAIASTWIIKKVIKLLNRS